MKYRTILNTTCIAATSALLAIGGTTLATAASGSGSSSGAGGARPAQAGQPNQARPPAPPFVKPAASYLGMKPAALMKQLKAGKTLTAIATASGKSVDGLKSAIIADAKQHLAADVEAGKLDQTAADAKLSELQSRIDDIVSKPLPARGPGNCPPPPAGGQGGPGAPAGGSGATGDTGYGTGGTAPATTTTGGGSGTYL